MMGYPQYQCDGCKMTLRFPYPVDRPCPDCGGTYHLLEPKINHPLQYEEHMRMKEESIDAHVAEIFPDVLAKLEALLADAAERG